MLANSGLTCGLQFITPATGRMADEDRFPIVLREMLADIDSFRPREAVLHSWAWPRTAERFAALIGEARKRKARFGN